MPDETPDLELADDAPIDQVRAALNRERERRRAAEGGATEAETLRREVAFLRAGVDSSHPAFSYFNAGYQGELEAEAIKAEWSKIAPTVTPTPAPTEEPPPANDASGGASAEELERLRKLRETFSGEGAPPGAESRKPLGIDVMDAAYEAQNPNGGVRARPSQGMSDKAMNAGFSRLFARANENDPEAVFKQPTEGWADATDRWRRSQG